MITHNSNNLNTINSNLRQQNKRIILDKNEILNEFNNFQKIQDLKNSIKRENLKDLNSELGIRTSKNSIISTNKISRFNKNKMNFSEPKKSIFISLKDGASYSGNFYNNLVESI